MSYLDHDIDLQFLGEMSSKELEPLVEILTKDKDGKTRYTENLTKHPKYKQYYPDHSKYWEVIGEEIQKFGGNSITNFVRKSGVAYKTILQDVSDKLSIKYEKSATTMQIEEAVLLRLIEQSLDKMSNDEKAHLAREIGVNNLGVISKSALLSAFQTIFKLGGFKSYQITLIIANAVLRAIIGRGLTFAGNAALTRSIAVFAGPIGWTITGAFTTIDLAGPAFRVTIPIVVQIALLRKEYEAQKANLKAQFEEELQKAGL
ncbi:DUF3944 domain-containing protein [Actinobacillus equuli subsp. haemolyticus]|uniref:DUF3944 domain-containing protein n=1 Tax=Actinobacillus equuli TaxID=718 RepID=UPI0024424CF3|nr:DUF3944 domain-containing protein [Actinobacillus equuli]WGE66699.1 DUF3944 domain-containing protein [Actinobacillus equuli subsp. haemolyticus]